MIIVGIFLFPIRLIVFGIALFNLWLTAKLMLCCGGEDETRFPISRPIGFFLMRVWARVWLWALGIWWIHVDRKPRSSGQDGVPQAPIIVANHVSFFDSTVFLSQGRVMPVAKAEIAKMPIFGVMGKAAQTIFVGRMSAESKHAVVEAINYRTRWRIEQSPEVLAEHGDWPPLLIFPEATNVNTTAVLQFKPGAFIPMMPVQPVCLDMRQPRLDLSWVGDASVLATMVRMMCQVYNFIKLTYLPVVTPADVKYDKKPRGNLFVEQFNNHISQPDDAPNEAQAFADTARAQIADELQIPMTNHTFLDSLLVIECQVLNLPEWTANVEMGNFPHGLAEAKKQIRLFHSLDKDGDGHLNKEEFREFLGLSDSMSSAQQQSLVDSLLSQWDVDGDGKIDFREFLLFGALLKSRHIMRSEAYEKRKKKSSNSPVPIEQFHEERMEEEKLLHSFALYFEAMDKDGDGRLSKLEFVRSVRKLNEYISEMELLSLFNQMDHDGDGYVATEHFLSFAQKQPVLLMSLFDAIASARPQLYADEQPTLKSMMLDNSFLLDSNTFLPMYTDSSGIEL